MDGGCASCGCAVVACLLSDPSEMDLTLLEEEEAAKAHIKTKAIKKAIISTSGHLKKARISTL